LFRFFTQDVSFWRIVMAICIAFAIILKHHSNISRMANGSERRMGQKKQ
jgi:glycerol-3-phosphate acyltransferase PlsY